MLKDKAARLPSLAVLASSALYLLHRELQSDTARLLLLAVLCAGTCVALVCWLRQQRRPERGLSTLPHWHVPPPTAEALERLRQGVTGDTFVIVGGGIAGLSCAAALARVGVPVAVLERDAGPNDHGAAITFWPNAFRVLDALGVAEPVRREHPPVTRMEINTADGTLLRSFGLDECPGAPHEARIVRRAALLQALRSAIPEECFHYGVSIDGVVTTAAGVEVRLAGGARLGARCLVACDGAKSRIGHSLGLRPASYAGEVYYRGLATFPEPEGCPEPPGTLRMIWGRGVRVGISTLSKTDCFWFTTLTCPEAVSSGCGEQRKAEALASVAGFAGHVRAAIRHTPPGLVTRSRIVDRWLPARKGGYGVGAITLAGDALHPQVPSLGQGGCTALEDGVVLAQLVRDAGGAKIPLEALEGVLRGYEEARCARCLPITVRSHLMGRALQIRLAPFCWARDLLVRRAYPVHSFLAPASFDCGPLPKA